MPAPESQAPSPPGPAAGRVYLVGAGPGDPGLLSARALELIARADAILYDRLVPRAALDGARADAQLSFVGKEGGGDSVAQEQIVGLLLDRAREGLEVVRLKGGDPFVFGRGGEEALALRAAGIEYEVVPGIPAGIAAAAYAGIPVTHRGLASAVALVTGHEDPGKGRSAIDWDALARFPGTLVFYMGVRRLPAIVDSLIAAGRSPREPAAVIERGTLPEQRCVLGELATIAERAAQEDVRAPSVTIIGAVAALAEELSWRPPQPLSGRTVAVTRARAQASSLAQRLASLGARVVQAPVIRTRPLPGPLPELGRFDLICLTSPTGVEQLFERLRAEGLDARELAGARIAVIGPGTESALAAQGIAADIVPEHAIAEGLLEELASLDPAPRSVLLARAREGRELLVDALRNRGIEVEVLALYETVAEAPPERLLAEALEGDYITFASASTVRFFLAALGDLEGLERGGHEALLSGPRIVSIGPITSEALRERGIQPHVEAATHDLDGLIEALVADAATRPG